MLEARDISYAISGKQLLRNVSLSAPAGEILAIIGPNGAGKSTLLKVMAGELRPASGHIMLNGDGVSRLKPADLAARRVVVPQATQLDFPFTAQEVVGLGLSVPGFAVNSDAHITIVQRAMQRIDVDALKDRAYQSLSGGERQRIHVARALCQLDASPLDNGKVLMLDEATANLDLSHQLLVLNEARRVAQAGHIVIAILHDWNLAACYADNIVLLDDGRLASSGRPDDVLTDNQLSSIFNCHVKCNVIPTESVPFVLPHACASIVQDEDRDW